MIIKERILATTRLILIILAAINSILVMQGLHPIPLDEEAVMAWVTHGVDAVVMLYCGWWKDNNITRKAIAKSV